jgi:pyruvate/2-oxoglutarate dehydrogenase complex dihydrolipoamide dehydrogenase (E3) component
MTEKQVRESGKKAKVARYAMSRVGRAIKKGETQGFMKVLIDARSEEILGAAILGVGGDEIVHIITDVMYAKKPYTLIKNAVHIHPTVSEFIPTMLGNLADL